LADFKNHISEFDKLQIRVIAASADSHKEAKKTVERYAIPFPVAHSLNAETISSLTGAFFDEENRYIHATGFILTPEGTVAIAVYSTGSIGRLTPKDSKGYIEHRVKSA
jgi:peroxiredoxin